MHGSANARTDDTIESSDHTDIRTNASSHVDADEIANIITNTGSNAGSDAATNCITDFDVANFSTIIHGSVVSTYPSA